MMCDPDEDYSSDEDEDYLPSGEASEGGSEDSDIEAEGHDGGGVKGQGKGKAKKGSKRKQNIPETKRSRTGGISLQDEEVDTEQTKEKDEDQPDKIFEEEMQRAVEMKKEEKEKKKVDDLWSSFLKDVGQKPKAKPQSSSGSSLGVLSKQMSSGMNGKEGNIEKAEATTSKKTVTITKIVDFAGEDVEVTEEVSADSKEAKIFLQGPTKPSQEAASSPSRGEKSTSQVSTAGSKRPGSGLSSVLGLINKKPKMSVLEKSRLDWTKFTKTEGITDDLKIHNKGKQGYIEKQKFLQQTDELQYEKERDLRMGLGTKR